MHPNIEYSTTGSSSFLPQEQTRKGMQKAQVILHCCFHSAHPLLSRQSVYELQIVKTGTNPISSTTVTRVEVVKGWQRRDPRLSDLYRWLQSWRSYWKQPNGGLQPQRKAMQRLHGGIPSEQSQGGKTSLSNELLSQHQLPGADARGRYQTPD